MKLQILPWLAAGLGLLMILLLRAAVQPQGDPLLPPLMLLFICEFGFLLTLIGAWIGARGWLTRREGRGPLLAAGACVLIALVFLYLGIALWSGLVPVKL